MGEEVDLSSNKIDHSSLRKMKIRLYHEELRNESMDDEEEISQRDKENTTINNIMDMCQQNVLEIQNLAKDVVEINKNTLTNDDTNRNL